MKNATLRSLTLTAALPLLAAAANAQCFVSQFGTLVGTGDDVVFAPQAMNITFPLGGLSATYTHAEISTNGVVYLSNGGATGGTNSGYPSQATFAGAAGQAPRIAPMWTDLELTVGNNAGVYFNDTIPGRFVITWANAWEWNTTAPIFTVQCQLFANGDVTFTYGPNAQSTAADVTAGVSAGNGVAIAADVDLSTGGNTATGQYMRELTLAGAFDLGGKSVTFTPAAGGFVETAGPCVTAYHDTYGKGCYDISDSFYQFFADSAGVPAALNGQSLTLTPAGSSYLAIWGGGTYAPPPATASALTVGDDGETTVAPSVPLSTPTGPVTLLYVHGNGMVSHAANNGIAPVSYVPDAAGFLDAPATGFFSWHDYNTSEVGSGAVKYHEATVGSDVIAYVTWDDVESYASPETQNRSTLQFQLNLSTGIVTMVWVAMDGNASSAYGSAHLVGWGPVGPSANGGSLNLATALPLVTSPSNVLSMAMSAAPNPISTTTTGTTVTYTATNVPPFSPTAGVYVSMHILSLGQVATGLDLGFLGAPGCNAYVTTLDYTQANVGFTSTAAYTFAVPPGVPAGTQIYSQTAALITPNSLPNGQNAFGLTVSNGVLSYISQF
jgi:hypothetical protein